MVVYAQNIVCGVNMERTSFQAASASQDAEIYVFAELPTVNAIQMYASVRGVLMEVAMISAPI